MSENELPPSGPSQHAATEHVHCELALFDTRNAVERVTEALRTAGAIGFVDPRYSEGERIGAVSVAIATQGGSALKATEAGIEVGLPLPELAEWLRRRLASGVIIHSDDGTEHAVTVPQNVGERMEAALSEPHAYPSVTIAQGTRTADEIDDLAFFMGGPTTLVPLSDERSALVAATRRPSMMMKELRPAVRLFHRDHVIEMMAWSTHAVRRLQGPLRRVRANTQADLQLVWFGPPVFLVEHDGGAAQALALQAGLWSPPQVQIGDQLRAALERMVRELGLPPERLDDLIVLAKEPYAPDVVERLVACLELPAEVSALVHEPERAGASGIAQAEPTGAMEQHLERQHLKRIRR